MPDKVICPKCGSDQLTTHKRGFSAGKAITGDLIAGPIGFLAGTSGSNKIDIFCMSCGFTWNPVSYKITSERAKKINDSDWATKFLWAYRRDQEKAQNMLDDNTEMKSKYGDIHTAKTEINKERSTSNLITLLVLVVFIVCMVYYFLEK